ncbi:MAG: 1-acyl-sn-glycerol-3-phosphate acyltransferase [Actinobacteria bacterium]|nr:1-acyl-sn-glycerol-3-phosphate acyltransferase [Actinomycetota bacterium]
MRSLLFNIAYWVLSMVYALMAVVAAALPGRGPTQWIIRRYTRRMVQAMRLFAGIELEVRGKERLPAGAFLIAAKHQSWGDGFCTYAQFEDLAFVIGAHMEKYPGVGLILRKLGVIIVDNEGGKSSRRALMQDAAQVRAEGRRILIYPEGHLAPVGKRYPYRSGVFHMYRTFAVPVVPAATNLGLFWPGIEFRKRPGSAVLEFLEPIPPGLPRGEFMARLEQAIEDRTAELIAEATGAPLTTLVAVLWLAGAVAALGVATAIAGSLVAGTQNDLKRALAASTSAQYGLVLVAVGAGSTAAAGAHLVTHAVFKALLFLGAGVALHQAGTLDLSRLRLGRVVPFAAGTFAVGAAALAAVPPLGAAWSKEEVLAAATHAGAWLGAGVLVASFLSALYAGRLAVLAFGPSSAASARIVEPGGGSAAPMVHKSGAAGPSRLERAALGGLAAASVALGVLWLPGAGGVVERASGGRLFEAAGWELPGSLAAIAAAGGLLAVLHRSSALVTLGLPDRLRAAVAGWLGLPGLARLLVVDPVLALSRGLAAFDDRVVDAGVRAAARVPVALSAVLSWWGERSVDGVVQAVAGTTLRAAAGSRLVDERGVDRAVEDLARGAGVAGSRSRKLQTGLAHHYYVLVALGLVALVAVAALGRS